MMCIENDDYDTNIYLTPEPIWDKSVGSPLYNEQDVVYFTDKSKASGNTYVGPVINYKAHDLKYVNMGPMCNINVSSPRLEVSFSYDRLYPFKETVLAVLFHIIVVILVFFMHYLFTALGINDDVYKNVKFVELNFGVNFDKVVNNNVPVVKNEQSKNDVEATKAKELLPQVPRSVAIDAPLKEKDEMVVSETKLIVTPKNFITPTPQIKLDKTALPGTKILSQEELAKRLEREKRKEAVEEQKGSHEKNDKGAPKYSEEIPDIPRRGDFVSNVSGNDLPIGDLNGKFSKVPERYGVFLSHMKKNWKLPEFSKYPSNLETIVEIKLNVLGKIIRLKVIKSSTVLDFDNNVLEAIKQAEPFPDTNDEPDIMRMKFNPANVRL